MRSLVISLVAIGLFAPVLAHAQDDDAPLGDVARAMRKARPADDQTVIDNDNLSVMMDQAESERLNGQPIFSIDPSGNAFRMTSPDGTCSLSFDAKATALISTPFVSSELPQDELLKLEGPAAIHDGVLEVSLHNGTGWEVKEIVVGITVLQDSSFSQLKPAKLIGPTNDGPAEKLPDTTMLYHLKATSPPDASTIFRANLGGDVDPSKEWRWALIGARGIPPAAPGSVEEPSPASIAPSLGVLPDLSLSQTTPVIPGLTPSAQTAVQSSTTTSANAANPAPAGTISRKPIPGH